MAEYTQELQAQLDAAHEMINGDQIDEAWIVLNRLEAMYPESAEVIALMGDAALKVGDIEFAYELFDRAIDMDPLWSDAWSARARCHLELCEIENARDDLDKALALDPANPEAHYYMAVLAEFAGDDIQAGFEYKQSVMVDGLSFSAPFRAKSIEDFELMVKKVLDSLPGKYQVKVPTIKFTVKELPDLDAFTENGLSPLILGMFVGDTIDTESSGSTLPPVAPEIIIFRRNIERICRKREDLLHEIEMTVMHEIGHYFGLEDDEDDEMDDVELD
jgi:predicted Zn-dependent protease with MMP-like domain